MELMLTLCVGLASALILGYIAQRLGLSTIVGYLLAGVVVGPLSPIPLANKELALEFAEVGVALLMFGVGLHFHLKDLLATWKFTVPGAVLQIALTTALGAWVATIFGWSLAGGIVFGLSLSVASTVVLIRVLTDSGDLHTPNGHAAVGWLVVEDLGTIFMLVVLPLVVPSHGTEEGSAVMRFGIATLKVTLFCIGALYLGRKLLPQMLRRVAATGSRELFTLAVLVVALGIALASAKIFGASIALGAFLAGTIVNQSAFGARAGSDALPMKDAFAVLFFVSVGMLMELRTVTEQWPLVLATVAVVMVGKPFIAYVIASAARRSLRTSLLLSAALGQIGEFSFILAGLGLELKILPPEATGILVASAIISISVNSILYRLAGRLAGHLEGSVSHPVPRAAVHQVQPDRHYVIIVGHGPVGRTVERILRGARFQVTIIEMNIETAEKLREAGQSVIHGDAARQDILEHAAIHEAEALIIAANVAPEPIVQAARALNEEIHILSRAQYLNEAATLRRAGADSIFTSEGEVALSMAVFLLTELGATPEQIDWERERVRQQLFAAA